MSSNPHKKNHHQQARSHSPSPPLPPITVSPSLKMSYNAERAQELSRLVHLQRKSESERLADRIVISLDEFIQDQCRLGEIKAQWSVPEVDVREYPEFNLEITKRAVRHYLRNGKFYWQQDVPCPNTYTISWEEGWTPPIVYNKVCTIV